MTTKKPDDPRDEYDFRGGSRGRHSCVLSEKLAAGRTWIDTQRWTCQHRPMVSKVKRTYNLAPSTVKRVREMAERYGVASSQDAVVELAVDELERRLRDARESQAWEAAATDAAFRDEVAQVEGSYRSADRETWPA